MTQLIGTFDVVGREEKPYDDAKSLPKLTHTEVCQEMHGDIEGEASITYLTGYRADNTAAFVGLVRVVGKIGDRDGSFVMQDVGTFENGITKGRWTIVPRLGTGDLSTIRGDGHFAAANDSATYMLDVSF